MLKRKDLSVAVGYELTRKIAEGGMGVVYEAMQHGAEGFSKLIAVKIIKKNYSSIREFRSNFIGEARLVSNLIHPNIVQTYHLGKKGNLYFIVMEYVKGVNLEEFMFSQRDSETQTPAELCAFLVSRICRGLSYAHNKRDIDGELLDIVHRDVSPRNIMLSVEGDVKLTDFGIAKAVHYMYSEEGEVIAGRDEYLSPEQARREVTDQRADLFSCGVILLELLLGYNFFENEDPEVSRDNILHLPLPDFTELSDEIDEELNRILHKALARDRDQRYCTAFEMFTELELYMYSDHYGPTTEKWADYFNSAFSGALLNTKISDKTSTRAIQYSKKERGVV